MKLTPENRNQHGPRKIQLSHLIFKLLSEGLLKTPSSILEIGPSSSGLGGLVLDQFEMTPIDAIEAHRPFYEGLLNYNANLLRNGRNHPVYGAVSLGRVEDLTSAQKYNLIFGFNAKAQFFDWEKLKNLLPDLLSDTGQVLLTLPSGDYPFVSLDDSFEIVLDELTADFIRDVGQPFVNTNGIIYDQLGLRITKEFYESNESDYRVVLANKR